MVGPDGVDFVAGDDALAFGSGVTDLNMVGPLELVVSKGAGEGLAELELLSPIHSSPAIEHSAPCYTRDLVKLCK